MGRCKMLTRNAMAPRRAKMSRLGVNKPRARVRGARMRGGPTAAGSDSQPLRQASSPQLARWSLPTPGGGC